MATALLDTQFGKTALDKLSGTFCLAALCFAPESYAATSERCPGETGYYFTNNRDDNPSRGGFVSNGAYVSESAFIAPNSAVCESASVEYGVRVMGDSIVRGQAIVEGKVRITGNAVIEGTAYITGKLDSPTTIWGWAVIDSGEITSGRHGTDQITEEGKKFLFNKSRLALNKLMLNIPLSTIHNDDGYSYYTRKIKDFNVTESCLLSVGTGGVGQSINDRNLYDSYVKNYPLSSKNITLELAQEGKFLLRFPQKIVQEKDGGDTGVSDFITLSNDIGENFNLELQEKFMEYFSGLEEYCGMQINIAYIMSK